MYVKNRFEKVELDLSIPRNEQKFNIPGKHILVDCSQSSDVILTVEGGTRFFLRYISSIKTPGFRYFFISNSPTSGKLTLYITTCGAVLDNSYVSYEQLKYLVNAVKDKLIEATLNLQEVVKWKHMHKQ